MYIVEYKDFNDEWQLRGKYYTYGDALKRWQRHYHHCPYLACRIRYENERKMQKEARKMIRRMLANKGYIADGIYEEAPRMWRSNNTYSTTFVDIVLFNYMKRERLLMKDNSGKYVPSVKGRRFAPALVSKDICITK